MSCPPLFFINDAAMTTPQLHTTKTIDRKWLVFIAIGTGSFMVALDGSVVNAILPILRDTFNSNVATIEWVVTVYLLVLSGLLLSFGRLGDLRGHKSVYVWGFVVFVASSALCGVARSAGMLIFFRGLQAIGGALLASNSPAIVTGNFPAEERGRAFGLVSMMTYLGLTVGPSLGGWLTHAFGWRTVFYINVPVGLLALTLSLIFIPKDSPSESEKRFDLPGATVFLAALTLLLLGLNKGADWGWTSSPSSGCWRSGGFHGRVHPDRAALPHPMLDLNLFRVPLFSASTARRDPELHLRLQHHLPDAVLPDPGAQFESRASRLAVDGAAGHDGDHRAHQRRALRQDRFALARDDRHGRAGRRACSCSPASALSQIWGGLYSAWLSPAPARGCSSPPTPAR